MQVAEATLHAVYLLCIAIVFGGTLALSFVSAPLLFKRLSNQQAGDAFGAMLGRFDRIGGVASMIAVLSAGVLAWIAADRARASIETVLAALLALVFLYLQKSLTPKIESLAPPRGGEDTRPEGARVAFDRLHKRYVKLYALNLFASAAALALP